MVLKLTVEEALAVLKLTVEEDCLWTQVCLAVPVVARLLPVPRLDADRVEEVLCWLSTDSVESELTGPE